MDIYDKERHIMKFDGILKRDNGGLYLQSHGKSYRLILQRMPVDLVEKQVVVTGEWDVSSSKDTVIIAEGIMMDDAFPVDRY